MSEETSVVEAIKRLYLAIENLTVALGQNSAIVALNTSEMRGELVETVAELVEEAREEGRNNKGN